MKKLFLLILDFLKFKKRNKSNLIFVQITKCSMIHSWYKNKIGQVFEVEQAIYRPWHMKGDETYKTQYITKIAIAGAGYGLINKSDCIQSEQHLDINNTLNEINITLQNLNILKK